MDVTHPQLRKRMEILILWLGGAIGPRAFELASLVQLAPAR